jgi:HK97 family phage portal protein
MALIERLFARAEKFNPLHPKDSGLSNLFRGLFSNTSSGIHVDSKNAMSITAVYSAVSIISESIGMLPWEVLLEKDGGKEKAFSDPRYNLVNIRPNRFQNTMEYRETMLSMLLLRGRAVAEVIVNEKGIITDLLPLHPDTIRPFMAPNGAIAIQHTPQGGKSRILLHGEFIDLKGLSLDGINCISPIEANAETLGISKAAEMYAGKYFGNSTVVSGVLETDEALSDNAYKRLLDWTKRHQGVGRSHNPAILEEGLSWKSITVSPEDSQLLETRSYQIEDIARMYRIPAYKLQRMDSVKFNTTEQQAIDFVTDTLLPRITRFELAHNSVLFSDIERHTMQSDIDLKGILRGDSKTRSEFYRKMWDMGAYNANKILKLEGENPIPEGDRYYVPVNVMPSDRIDELLDAKTRPQPVVVEQNSE